MAYTWLQSLPSVAAIENFDDIGMDPCDCEICRSGENHYDAGVSRVDKEPIEQVTYGVAIDKADFRQGIGKPAESGQAETFAEYVKPEERNITEHVTLLLQSMRAYLGLDEFPRALGPGAYDFSALCDMCDDELRIGLVVHPDNSKRALAYFKQLQVDTHTTAHVRRHLARKHRSQTLKRSFF